MIPLHKLRLLSGKNLSPSDDVESVPFTTSAILWNIFWQLPMKLQTFLVFPVREDSGADRAVVLERMGLSILNEIYISYRERFP